MDDRDEVIAVRDLRMAYRRTEVLRGGDFTVRAGEVVALLGPNGAGKSTTVEILEGFRLPSAGVVRVLGQDPGRADERWRADVGIVLQSWRDHGKWRVRELLAHLGRYYRLYSTPHRPRPFGVDELLELVGLAALADRRIDTLSGGQRRRLDVAVGIVGRPRLLFLDEPTVPLVVLILNRDATWSGLPVAMGTAMLPGFLALMIVFSLMGTAYYLANEREDGTLLRAKAVPGGMSAYVVGLTVLACLDAVAGVLVVLLPGMFIVPGVPVGDPLLWLGVLGYTMLGLLACMPIGVLAGSVVRSPRVIGGLGFLLTMGLSAISGIYFPIQALWGWVQAVAQVFPMYWLGLGLRSVFLPADAAAAELDGSWRVLETLAVLGLWAAAGLVGAPVVLRRMARRESGSAVEARRQRILQRS